MAKANNLRHLQLTNGPKQNPSLKLPQGTDAMAPKQDLNKKAQAIKLIHTNRFCAKHPYHKMHNSYAVKPVNCISSTGPKKNSSVLGLSESLEVQLLELAELDEPAMVEGSGETS